MCRSKRKRIRNKWLKNPKNYIEGPDTSHVYQIKDSNSIMCHPIVAKKIKEAIPEHSEMDISFNGKFISDKPFAFDFPMPEFKPVYEPEFSSMDRMLMFCGIDYGYPNSLLITPGII